jgi:hypothetical protein
MITKNISTEHGDVVSTAEVMHTDNGQLVLHIVSTLAVGSPPKVLKHEHRVTVGAEDGRDGITRINHCSTCHRSEEQKAIASLSAEEVQALVQKHLDEKRAEAAAILSGRAQTAKITALLS